MPHPLAEQFRWQSRHCLPGSPLSATLLAAMADDLDDGGPTATVMQPYADQPATSVPALRLLGALHRLVLEREAPQLAMHYPSVGGSAPVREAWPSARRLLDDRAGRLTELAGRPCQTNEVGRSAVLFGALLTLTTRYRLPIRLLEIGASAGLNLNVDRYGYAVDGQVLGAADSPLRLRAPWRGHPPADLGHVIEIAERAGCDLHPVDLATTEGRLTLTSFVWADWLERFERLRTAMAVAAEHPVLVERAHAAPWLAGRLGRPRPGGLTVVWHSVFWYYVDAAGQDELHRVIAAAGARATATAPLALVGMENVEGRTGRHRFDVSLTTWPGGRREVLGVTEGHGIPTIWAAAPAAPARTT